MARSNSRLDLDVVVIAAAQERDLSVACDSEQIISPVFKVVCIDW
jgi:hypothetical protein